MMRHLEDASLEIAAALGKGEGLSHIPQWTRTLIAKTEEGLSWEWTLGQGILSSSNAISSPVIKSQRLNQIGRWERMLHGS